MIKDKINTDYKYSPLGLIPNDWEVMELGKVAIINMGQSPDSNYYNDIGEGMPLIQGNADMLERKSIQRIYTTQITKTCDKGDFILSVRAPVGSVGIASYKSCIGRGVCSIKPTKVDKQYLHQLLINSEDKWSRIEQGSTFSAVSSSDVRSFKLLISHSLPEQKAIASLLSTWDAAIQNNAQLIAQKELYKKWLMQQLLTGKKRLKGFENTLGFHKSDFGLKIPKDWEIVNIEDVFVERNERSNDQSKYPLFSLTIENGVTEKTDRYERSFLLKDQENNQYKMVYPDDILFNPMNLRFGAIAKSEIKFQVLVSAYYNAIKKSSESIDINYYEKLFKTKTYNNFYERIAIGSLIEKKRVHLSNFFKLQIPLPPLKEQLAISKVMQAADKEIQLLKAKMDKLKEQKKGLMQVLLTGKKRMKIN